MPDQTWDLWFPSAGATGLAFCRATVSADVGDVVDVVLVHAAPPQLAVTVRDDDGTVAASGTGLERTAPGHR